MFVTIVIIIVIILQFGGQIHEEHVDLFSVASNHIASHSEILDENYQYCFLHLFDFLVI